MLSEGHAAVTTSEGLTSPIPPRVMISYRRDDTSVEAAALYDAFIKRFGKANVFFDLDRIAPGANWVATIDRAVAQSDVVLVLIGPGWVTACDPGGTRRLEKDSDFVRREIETALQHPNVRVIPVRVRDAAMPTSEDLPQTLVPLTGQQAFTLASDKGRDMAALIRQVEGVTHPWPATLRRPQSSFVGRQSELAHLASLILESDVRLVTLTGPGGTGKTRLAIECAARLAHRFAEGVCFIDLTEVRDSSLVLPIVAQAINVDGRIDELIDIDVLVVLDNFEHVIDAAPDVAAFLVRSSRTRVVCTSRSPLRISREHVVLVDPLVAHDATELFLRRARERGVEVRQEDIARHICARLDGLPLAVELAAARVDLYSLSDLEERLDDALAVLVGGHRDLPDRHKTMSATLEWSYALLSDEGQQLLTRLAVFHGSFSFNGADQVAAARDHVIGELVDASLARRRDTLRGSRFEILGVVREFGIAKTRSSEGYSALCERHCAYYADFTGLARVGFSLEPDIWVDELTNELANLRAALDWAARNDVEKSLVQLVGGLGRLWGRLLPYSELTQWAKLALDASAGKLTADRARCLHAAGIAAFSLGDVDSARNAFAESADLWRRLGAYGELAKQLSNLGSVAVEAADYTLATTLYEQAVEAAREASDAREEAAALGNLGVVLDHRGESAEALSVFEDVAAKAGELDDDDGRAWALSNAGTAALTIGRYEQATSTLRQALPLLRRLEWHEGIVYTLIGLSRAAIESGDSYRALRLASASERLATSLGMQLQKREAWRLAETLATLRSEYGNDFQRKWTAAAEDDIDEVVSAECEA